MEIKKPQEVLDFEKFSKILKDKGLRLEVSENDHDGSPVVTLTDLKTGEQITVSVSSLDSEKEYKFDSYLFEECNQNAKMSKLPLLSSESICFWFLD